MTAWARWRRWWRRWFRFDPLNAKDSDTLDD